MNGCPSYEKWEEFLADQLPQEEDSRLNRHLSDCQACIAQLEQMTNPSTLERVADFLQTLPRRTQNSQRMVDALMQVMRKERLPAEEAMPLPEIAGYQIQNLIGQGGSSRVYRAVDTRLGRTVAVKLLHERSTPQQRQRFHKEAQALASLQHVNIATILEVGETPEHSFMVLEFVAGGSLAQYAGNTPQAAQESARLVIQLATAIQRAHDTGLVHRDLKPGNILLEPHFGAQETSGLDRFLPKIIDFGIVKELHSTEDFTQTRDFVGTPSYMAPEQIGQTKQGVDGRTDVYALGVILYELLTGRPPFRAASPIDTMLQIKHEEPVPPSRFEPKLPRDLETICLKCLEKDPTHRYGSAQLLAEDLQRFLEMKPVHARPLPWVVRSWRWSRRYPGWAFAGLLFLLILLTLAVAGPIIAHREHRLREEAAFEKNRSQEHLEQAGQALEEMLDRLLANMRLQELAYDDVQQGMVTFAAPYLERFVEQVDSSPTLRLRQARSLLQLAMVQTRAREFDKAQATYQQALKQIGELDRDASIPRHAIVKSQFSAQMEYARFLMMYRQDNQEAEVHFRECLKLIDQFSDAERNGKFLDSIAILHSLAGSLLQDMPGKEEESLRHTIQAMELRRKLMVENPQRDDLRHYAAMAHLNLAVTYRKLKNNALQIEQLQQALALEKEVNQSKSHAIDSAYHIVTMEGELGLVLRASGKHEQAMRHFQNASTMANALVTLYPAVEKYGVQAKQWKRAVEQFSVKP